MSGHREHCEKGAGIMGWSEEEKSLFSFKDLKHDEAWRKYCSDKRKSPFWLFHSRMPSAGDVTIRNVQPFHGKETIGFCHNGTLRKEQFILPLAALGEYLNGTESDSYLLYRLLYQCHPMTAKMLLVDYRDNFVYAHVPTKSIYVIGHFKLEMKNKKLSIARNNFGEPKVVMVCDFDGTVKEMKKEKPYVPTHYFMNDSPHFAGHKKKRLDDSKPVFTSAEEEKAIDEFLNGTPSPQLEADFEHLEGLQPDSEDDKSGAGESKSG